MPGPGTHNYRVVGSAIRAGADAARPLVQAGLSGGKTLPKAGSWEVFLISPIRFLIGNWGKCKIEPKNDCHSSADSPGGKDEVNTAYACTGEMMFEKGTMIST